MNTLTPSTPTESSPASGRCVPREPARWGVVVVFATAMGYLEAAVVLYLRTLGNRIDPYQTPLLPPSVNFGFAEVAREAATIVMLGAVGWLAGRNFRARFGYFLISFGVWDIFYYVFLKPLTGWPRTLVDWDVLFLIPLPWWGPVIAPACIAILMILYGTLLSQFEPRPAMSGSVWRVWLPAALGIALALYVFMADAISVASQGKRALQNMLPARFNWPLFLIALGLMSAPILAAGWRLRAPRKEQTTVPLVH